MAMDGKWNVGIINGIGPCAFWLSGIDGDVWEIKNMTSFVQNPETGQMGLRKWPLAEVGFISKEIQIAEDHLVWVEDAPAELAKGLSNLWDQGSNGKILRVERDIPDAFRR